MTNTQEVVEVEKVSREHGHDLLEWVIGIDIGGSGDCQLKILFHFVLEARLTRQSSVPHRDLAS